MLFHHRKLQPTMRWLVTAAVQQFVLNSVAGLF